MVLGVGPHLSFAGKGSGLEFGAIAIGAGARARPGREHNGSACSAFGANEGVGLGGGEPPLDRRNSFCGCHVLQCSGAGRGGPIPQGNLSLVGQSLRVGPTLGSWPAMLLIHIVQSVRFAGNPSQLRGMWLPTLPFGGP